MIRGFLPALLLSTALLFPCPAWATAGEAPLVMNISVDDHVMTATLVDNTTTEALLIMLSEDPITLDMRDYAGMEKVATLPQSLPVHDESIDTEAGDLILYQGNSFVIYYDTNTWSLTRIGNIDDITQQELIKILGRGDVTVTLSLPGEE